jgi:pilus assembly protein FimV
MPETAGPAPAPVEPAPAPVPAYEPPPPAPVSRTEPAPRAGGDSVILPAPRKTYSYGDAEPVATAPEEFERFPRIPIDVAAARTEELRTQRGDTLSQIAQRVRPDDSISLPQMMMALLRANPEAFYNDNINNLKSGYVLRVPSREEIQSLSRAQAMAEVSKQNALWREYRAQVAGQAVPQGVVAGVPAGEAAPAADGEAVGEALAGAAEGRLELVGTEAQRGAEGGQVVGDGEDTASLQRELALLREQVESRRMETQELQSRVRELEETLARKDRLIELKDEELRNLQARIEAERAPTAGPAEEPAAEPMPEAVPEPEVEVAPTAEERPETADTEAAAPEAVEPAPAESPMAEAPVAEAPMDTETAPAPVPEPKVTPPQPAPAPSFLDDLLANPNMLMAAGFGGLLILALVALLLRRGKGGDKPKAEKKPKEKKGKKGKKSGAAEAVAPAAAVAAAPLASEAAEPAPAAESPARAEAAAERDFDLEAEAHAPVDLESTQAISAASPAPAGETGDIETDETTEEADVYIAYGLYQQAEDLLKTAIAGHPDKLVYRLKLAETYFAARNLVGFEEAARDLHEALGDESSPMWARVAAMGKELKSDNPLFTGTDTGGFSAADFEREKPVTADIDLGADLDESLPTPQDDALDLGGDLDLGDFDLGEEEPMQEEVSPGFASADGTIMDLSEAAETDVLDLGDFGADLDLGEGAAADTEASDELEFDLGEFDLGGDEADTETKPGAEATDDALDVGLELDTSDFDLGGAEAMEEPSAVDETVELDVGDLDLGLDEAATAESEGLAFGEEEEESDLISGGDEVGTKLDLAKAYIDMGDDEGARSTLEEVMTEGNAEQKKEAQALLNQIA